MARTEVNSRSAASNRSSVSGPYRQDVSNLVYNGDFEYAPPFTAATTTSSRFIIGTAAGSTGDDSYGWCHIESVTGSTQFDNVDGRTVMKVSSLSGGSAYAGKMLSASVLNLKRSGIPVLPSTSYTLSYSMKTNYTSGDSNDGCFVRAQLYTGTAGSVNTQDGTKIKTTTDWTEYTKTFTTGATTRFIDIQCRVKGDTGTADLNMDAWFDNVVLTPTAGLTRSTA